MKIEMTVEEFKELMNVTKKTDDGGNRFEFELGTSHAGFCLSDVMKKLETTEFPEGSKVKIKVSSLF